ncbi:MAG: hypothetical protein ACT4OL_00460 [Nitrospiraceae bacterium]
MQEYGMYSGAACLILAFYTLVKGIATAWRQRRENDPTDTAPSVPFGVAASLLLTLGLGLFRVKFPWWGVMIIFPGTVLLFHAIIYEIGRRPPQR